MQAGPSLAERLWARSLPSGFSSNWNPNWRWASVSSTVVFFFLGGAVLVSSQLFSPEEGSAPVALVGTSPYPLFSGQWGNPICRRNHCASPIRVAVLAAPSKTRLGAHRAQPGPPGQPGCNRRNAATPRRLPRGRVSGRGGGGAGATGGCTAAALCTASVFVVGFVVLSLPHSAAPSARPAPRPPDSLCAPRAVHPISHGTNKEEGEGLAGCSAAVKAGLPACQPCLGWLRLATGKTTRVIRPTSNW